MWKCVSPLRWDQRLRKWWVWYFIYFHLIFMQLKCLPDILESLQQPIQLVEHTFKGHNCYRKPGGHQRCKFIFHQVSYLVKCCLDTLRCAITRMDITLICHRDNKNNRSERANWYPAEGACKDAIQYYAENLPLGSWRWNSLSTCTVARVAI